MAAEPNIAGMARLLYLVGRRCRGKLGIVGRGPGLDAVGVARLGGMILVLGLIGYSPLHAWFLKKH